MSHVPVQVRLEEHHLAAIDNARTLYDAKVGLSVTLSRQQVIIGLIEQWMAQRVEQWTAQHVVAQPPTSGAPDDLPSFEDK